MAKVEVVLPAMGEGIVEATITRWIVEKGSKVDIDEALVEIATDKVDSELPSPASGKLADILFHEGEIPKVGQVIAVIDDGKKEPKEELSKTAETESKKLPNKKPTKKTSSTDKNISEQPQNKLPSTIQTESRFFSPFIRKMAAEREISFEELNLIEGTGDNGRLTKNDLNAYITQGRNFKNALKNLRKADIKPGNQTQITDYKLQPGERIVEMDRTRKLIAQHMVESKHIAPHVSSTVEVDVTRMVQWREKNKDTFLKENNIKLTYTPIITLAVAYALKKYPGINVSVRNESIIEKEKINIGVATALNDGNLIVPVIKNADRLNLKALVEKISDLSNRARQNKLLPAEIQNGTFTITNMGQFGNITGFPIINQPQVGILAVGSIVKKPAVVTVNNEQTIGIRDIMVLTMSYDHRVVDGALGGMFLKTIGDFLFEFSGT